MIEAAWRAIAIITWGLGIINAGIILGGIVTLMFDRDEDRVGELTRARTLEYIIGLVFLEFILVTLHYYGGGIH